MKKVLFATGIAVLALATVAGAQGAVFTTNLSVGSSGPQVVALQTALMSAGYNIPAIASGAASKGYFGSQTQAAVKLYQAARGIPNTGFVGPLTRAALNGGTAPMAGAPSTVTCPAGFVCTPVAGTAPVSGGSTGGGITTVGVPGIMTVTAGPISNTVLNVGQQMVPVLTIRVQAQYSDLDVQSLTLNVGNNTAIYNKLFHTIAVTDGNTVLASQALNGSTVVQSGSEYLLGIAGFHFFVPKGTYKDIVIKGSLNSSIDSSYYSASGSNYPDGIGTAQNSINATAFTGWGLGVVANGVRGVDGAGLNLYGPVTGFYQALTVNQSLVDNAQANVSLAPESPLVQSIPVNDTTNGQYLGLPVLVFNVNAQNDALQLRTINVGVVTSGTGSVGAAYLYQGSTMVSSASVSGGVASFSNIAKGTPGSVVSVNTTVPYTVKVDVTGVTSGSLTVTASTTGTQTILSSNDSTVTVNGAATGNTQTIASVGPLYTLVGTPTITYTTVANGVDSNSTTTFTARFNVKVRAVGTDILFGLTSSTTQDMFSTATSSVATSSFTVYKNSVSNYSTTAADGGLANYITNGRSVSVNYSRPTGTTLSSDGTTFTLPRNGEVTVPVEFAFSVPNFAVTTDKYAVQLQGINSVTNAGATITTFMANQPEWRTPNNL